MKFARFVEKEVRSEREASVAVLRECVVGKYDHLTVRGSTALSQLLQHAETRALLQLQVKHDRIPLASAEKRQRVGFGFRLPDNLQIGDFGQRFSQARADATSDLTCCGVRPA